MTKKEVELIAMLIRIHRKLDSIHNETEVTDEFMIGYVASKLSFDLKEKDIEQIKKYLDKCRKKQANTQTKD